MAAEVLLVNGNSTRLPLAPGSVQMVVTSPPYWGLREYAGTGRWVGGDPNCDHDVRRWEGPKQTQGAQSGHAAKRDRLDRGHCHLCGAVRVDNQIGLEAVPDCLGWATGAPCGECFVCHLVAVFREIWRVLRDDGVVWLNLGDSYNGSGGAGGDYGPGGLREGQPRYTGRRVMRTGRAQGAALKPKDLVGAPWRVALALQADGWYLRSDTIWAKPNPMPESVEDRPTKAHEYLFLLAKSEQYYYDAAAIYEPVSKSTHARVSQDVANQIGSFRAAGGAKTNGPMKAVVRAPKAAPPESGIKNNTSFNQALALPVAERNKRSVWTIPVAGYSGAHYATYPPALVEPCIRAGTSEAGACSICGAPWERVLEHQEGDHETGCRPKKTAGMGSSTSTLSLSGNGSQEWAERGGKKQTTGWRPTCSHPEAPTRPCIVLDPFSGSGTTGLVARGLGRHFVGIDLSYQYIREDARERLGLNALAAWVNGRKVETPADLGPLFGGIPYEPTA